MVEGVVSVGVGTLGGRVPSLGKTFGEPGSELLFNSNPLLANFGDVFGDFSTPRALPPLLAAIDSNFETKAWLSSSGEGEGEPWMEFRGDWWGEFLADPLSDPP